MQSYSSIGAMIKWFIQCRNKTQKETARAMGIKETTFSAQLLNDTVTAETLFKLAAYLDMDLHWMMVMLGYHGHASMIDREMVPRMSSDFREIELKHVLKRVDALIKENPTSTTDTRKELLKEFGKNMFYLLDVLIPADYGLYMIFERGKPKYYVDIPQMTRELRQPMVMRRKRVSALYEGSKALDIVIEERKERL